MSVSYYSYVVVGYRLSDLCRWERRVGKEERFHEVTGQPYLKDVSKDVLVVLGKDVPTPDEPGIPEEWPFLKGGKGVTVVDIGEGSSNDLSGHVWGIVLADASRQGIKTIVGVEEATERMHGLLDALIATLGVAGASAPYLFLVNHVSC